MPDDFVSIGNLKRSEVFLHDILSDRIGFFHISGLYSISNLKNNVV